MEAYLEFVTSDLAKRYLPVRLLGQVDGEHRKEVPTDIRNSLGAVNIKNLDSGCKDYLERLPPEL